MPQEKPGQLHSSWQAVLGKELHKPYMQALRAFLQGEKSSGKVIYPPSAQIFNAFNHTPFDQVRVVIIGQDPYHGPRPVSYTHLDVYKRQGLERSYGAPTITKDGVSVAKEIELKDKFENMGAQMVKEVASKTSDIAGDGTTTATVLAQAIIREGMKSVAAGMNPMDLKRGIDKAVTAAIADLKAQSKPCTTCLLYTSRCV